MPCLSLSNGYVRRIEDEEDRDDDLNNLKKEARTETFVSIGVTLERPSLVFVFDAKAIFYIRLI